MRTILVVDDHQINRRLLKAILEAENYQILEANDGEHGLATAAANKSIDAVILDMLMPNMDGFTFCERLRAKNAFIPIIVYTSSYIDYEDEQNALKLGATRFLRKPAIKSLIVILKELLGATK